MEWTDIRITVPKAEAETAEAIATGIAGGGIYIEDYSDLEEQVEAIAHVDLIEQELRDKDRRVVAVHLYLSPDESPREVLELLRERRQKAELHAQLFVTGVEEAAVSYTHLDVYKRQVKEAEQYARRTKSAKKRSRPATRPTPWSIRRKRPSPTWATR